MQRALHWFTKSPCFIAPLFTVSGAYLLGRRQGTRPHPNNFSDFCFTKCNKTFSTLHLCCHLHLPRQQIMVDLWATTWLHTSVLSGFHFGFELKNNYYAITNNSVISVIIVLSKKQTGSYSKIYRNCFYVACKDRTLSNPWVKSFSCIKMTSMGTS